VSVLTVIVAVVAIVLCGAASGVFFAFSTSVMPGLDAIKPDQAINAMVSMNRKIINPAFLAAFVGTPFVTAVTGVLLLVDDATGAALFFFAATVVYLLGAVAPTAVVNVPLNNALDAGPVPAADDEVARMWSDYSTRWTRWNHWRAVFSLATLVLLGLGLLVWDYAG